MDLNPDVLRADYLKNLARRCPTVVAQRDAFDAVYLPIAKLLLERMAGRSRFCIGIVGGPGCGKTTMAHSVAFILRKLIRQPVLVASLEDFYFGPRERKRRGVKWRALPGSHDLSRLARFFREFRAGRTHIVQPRYDMVFDRKKKSLRVKGPHKVLIFEGWLLSHRQDGYEFLYEEIDYLILLQAGLASMRGWRLARERRFRETHGGGYSNRRVQVFWNEVLRPGAVRYLREADSQADLVVRYNRLHRPTRLVIRS